MNDHLKEPFPPRTYEFTLVATRRITFATWDQLRDWNATTPEQAAEHEKHWIAGGDGEGDYFTSVEWDTSRVDYREVSDAG